MKHADDLITFELSLEDAHQLEEEAARHGVEPEELVRWVLLERLLTGRVSKVIRAGKQELAH